MNVDSNARAAFYLARDRRTLEYGGDIAALERPITLRIADDAARTRTGQMAARALTDLLVRAHRRLRILAPDVPVVDEPALTLGEQLTRIAVAIDPYQAPARAELEGEIQVVVASRPIGGQPADIATGWGGGRGEVHIRGEAPAAANSLHEAYQSGNKDEDDLLGAATAVCLAAAATFLIAHDGHPHPTAVNLLERTEGADATPATARGPVDVGRVDVLGAGAVAHGLAYWLREFGVVGDWRFVDRDDAELHNTNRCMGMTAAAAGWPGGRPEGAPINKAKSAAGMIGADAIPRWFHELPPDRERVDLQLVLANEHGVRTQAASVGDALLLHATTSPNWTAELHRHVAGRDDCPGCRIPQERKAKFPCSTGVAVPDQPTSGDAALPFLSACAGLMLAIALLDLADEQKLLEGRHNHWRLNLELNERLWQRLPHLGGRCPHELDASIRRAISLRAPRRWDEVGA